MTRDVIPRRPAGPDRHPASSSAGLAGPALAGEAGSATSPTSVTYSFPLLDSRDKVRAQLSIIDLRSWSGNE